MKKNQNISVAKLGMSRDLATDALDEQAYSIAINMNMENESGEQFKLKSEHSNILASKFKAGFKVIGFGTNQVANKTIFLLTNPTTGASEIGFIKNNTQIASMNDVERECPECNFERVLAEPLENITQPEHQIYETEVNDECNQCLNFDINYPVRNIVIKTEKLGAKYFWSDGLNPPRYYDESRKAEYLVTGAEVCGVDNTEVTCLDCSKLRVFPEADPINLEVESIELGGSLPLGTYSFVIAYADQTGQVLSEYQSLTQEVAVFDPNNRIRANEEALAPTNYAIKLRITGADPQYKYYKIITAATNEVDQGVRYFEVGLFPVTTNSVLFATTQGKVEAQAADVIRRAQNIKTLAGLTEANNHLIGYGVTREKEWNLQPVVNLMGPFLKWQTHLATESLYQNGALGSKYKGYIRDEVYPLGISFKTKTGFKTAVFPLVGRPAEAFDTTVLSNTDTASLDANLVNCAGVTRNQRWQIYNTATEEGQFPTAGYSIQQVIEPTTKSSITTLGTSVSESILIEDPENFDTLENYINADLETGCSSGASYCNEADPNNYVLTVPPFTNCTAPQPVGEALVRIDGDIVNERLSFTYIEYPSEYRKLVASPVCSMYQYGSSDEGFIKDNDFRDEFFPGVNTVYYRNYTFTNDRPRNAYELTPVTDATEPVNTLFFHDYAGFKESTTAAVLAAATQAGYNLSTSGLTPVSGGFGGSGRWSMFDDTLHQNALWFYIDVESNPEAIIEIIKGLNADGDDIVDNSNYVRIAFWSTTDPSTALFDELYDVRKGWRGKIQYNANTGNLIVLNDDNTPGQIINVANYNSTETKKRLYFTIECGMEAQYYVSPPGDGAELVIAPTAFCFGVAIRNREVATIYAEWDAITFEAIQRYAADCTTEVPIVGDCEVAPYKYGKFAYWESIETYPDNEELYDSSTLTVTPGAFTNTADADAFEAAFATGISGGTYTLDAAKTNLRCTPIRHFKFPDNEVSPFMYDTPQSSANNALVFPLGVTIDDTVVNDFLDLAVTNGLLTQEQRDSILEYEIYRGDRTLDKGVVAKGLLYDMYNYVEDEKQIWFANFPYNDLGDNQLIFDENRTAVVSHPDSDEYTNSNYTFHSPETEFYKPTLPTDLKLEGYQFGKSKGVFEEVEDHPKYVILGDGAKRLARRLATLEVVAEAAIIAAESAEVYRVQVGVANSANPVGIGLNIAAVALNAIGSAVYKYAKYKYQWEQSFRENGNPQNFAYYYTSVGKYNYMDSDLSLQIGNKVRGINKAAYLKPGRSVVVNEVAGQKVDINHIKREEAVFISLGDYPLLHKEDYISFDNQDRDPGGNSRVTAGSSFACSKGRSPKLERNIASPYVALKNYLPAQYGSVDSITWLTTSYKGDLNTPTADAKPIFGGDAFIARHTLKRKAPLFLRTAMKQSHFTPFNYRSYGNFGTQPAYYANFLSPDEVSFDRDLPVIDTEYIFDCQTRRGDFYINPPSKFYLYYYGIPSYLTETTINLNYRIGGAQPKDQFYPLFEDYVEWTQETFIPISENNSYKYEPVYSALTKLDTARTLSALYNKEKFDTIYDSPNGLVYSRPDNNENALTEPWLTFLPNDRYDFPTSYGRLVEIKGIEKEFVMCRFDNLTATFNAIDTIVDDGTKPETQNLGDGFKRRPVTFYETDLGYGGSQTASSVSCEMGHFFVDAKRGQVFMMMPGAQGLQEISAVINGKPSGLRNWFKSHLPFKVLTPIVENYEVIDTDNPYNGIGIVMGWDSRYKRVFLTKKDYQPLRPMTYTDGQFFDGATPIALTNTTYFKDVSFTIAFSALTGTWISYYDYHPNYYVNHNNYFQTGINLGAAEQLGVWSHLLTNKSYGVFYGAKHDIVLEYPIKNNYASKTLETVQLWTNGIRYHNEHDYAHNRDVTFNKMYIHNKREASGDLRLVPQKTLRQNAQYPKTNGTTQEILITNTNDRWNANYFFNRVISETNNQPITFWDENQIRRTFNPRAVSFRGKRVLEPLRGTDFMVNLGYDTDSRFLVEFNWAANEEEIR